MFKLDESTGNSSSTQRLHNWKRVILTLVVAGTKDAINMVEAGAQEVAEDIILEAIMFGHGEIIKLIEFQEKIVAEVGKAKMEIRIIPIR